MVKRLLNLKSALGKKSSALLFGARGVGKTSLARSYFEAQKEPVLSYDLLKFDVYDRYLKDPSLFRAELEFEAKKRSHPLWVWVDEVQKLPALLDEIHSLMESHKGAFRFLLMGSSARKLKRTGANLLAGRALTLTLHPLTHLEYDNSEHSFLKWGSLPGMVIDQENPALALKSYVSTYLKEEIMQEALVRRVDAFSRFLEVAAQFHGETVNASALGKSAGVSSQTIGEYLQILEDTLIARRLPGWNASVKKQLRTSPKLYLFDNGVANALRGELGIELRESSSRFGKLFEAWVVQELFRVNEYRQWDFKYSYWRTKSDVEVDIIVSRGAGQPLAAIEIKSSTAPTSKDLSGLMAFHDEYPNAKLMIFCRTRKPYFLDKVEVLPWRSLDVLGEL